MVKTFFLALCLSLFALCSSATAETPNIEVKLVFSNIADSKGQLLVGIYNKAEGAFNTSSQIAGKIVPAKAGKMQFIFQLPAGQYAIGVIHDKNSNNQLDTNFLGIPTEDYGFSNSAQRPDFEKAKINITHNQTIYITMQ